MMLVGRMGMGVLQRVVPMPMRVRLSRRVHRSVTMLVVRIVRMAMGMRHRRMNVAVLVMLGNVQPDSDCHQGGGSQDLERQRLAQHQDRRSGAEERRR